MEFIGRVSKYGKKRLHMEIPKCIRHKFKSGDYISVKLKDVGGKKDGN